MNKKEYANWKLHIASSSILFMQSGNLHFLDVCDLFKFNLNTAKFWMCLGKI